MGPRPGARYSRGAPPDGPDGLHGVNGTCTFLTMRHPSWYTVVVARRPAARSVSLRPVTMAGLALRVIVLAAIALAVAGKEGKTVKKQLRSEPEPDAPEVQLSVGWMSGRWVRTRAGRMVAAFTKIPYAQPPVEELRFKVGDV